MTKNQKKVLGTTAGKQQQQQDSSNSIGIKWKREDKKKAGEDKDVSSIQQHPVRIVMSKHDKQTYKKPTQVDWQNSSSSTTTTTTNNNNKPKALCLFHTGNIWRGKKRLEITHCTKGKWFQGLIDWMIDWLTVWLIDQLSYSLPFIVISCPLWLA